MERAICVAFGVFLLSLILCNFSSAGVAPNEIVLYWSFDSSDDGDQSTDISEHGHHGVVTAGELVEGKYGKGLQFDGVATFIELAHHDDFIIPEVFF